MQKKKRRMTEEQYRLFKAIVIVIALVVTAIYFRYGYLSPHYRYDRLTGQMQTMTPGGKWVQEKLTDKKI